MKHDQTGEITLLLHAAQKGQPGAADRLMALVYEELRKIAHNRVKAASPGLLEPTTLVHEAYLRLFKSDGTSWDDRHHFFWAAARAMRDILVERAKYLRALKRGGHLRRTQFSEDLPVAHETEDLIEVNDAIRRLEMVHKRAADIVMLRFFAGLTREQIAEILDMTESAVWREWSFAKAWLLNELEGGAHNRDDASQET